MLEPRTSSSAGPSQMRLLCQAEYQSQCDATLRLVALEILGVLRVMHCLKQRLTSQVPRYLPLIPSTCRLMENENTSFSLNKAALLPASHTALASQVFHL
jgi:hypothetical protein